MTHRQIKVRVGNYLSKTHSLNNGIPQGSPLSVILFVIAYQKLVEIIDINKEIQISAYADDFNLLVKLDKEKNITINLDSLALNISNWCSYSGASISLDKCKHMHICNKHNCHCTISFGNFHLQNVRSLKMLGVLFNAKHNWNSHIDYLIDPLHQRLNIIKCLSSLKYNCSTLTLISVVKALLLSKIDFALPLYGNAPKTSIKKINTIIHSAIRFALGAFRSTPIKNLFFEANIPPLNNRKDKLTANLFTTIINSSDSPLYIIMKNYRPPKSGKKFSTIDRIIYTHNSLGIHLKPISKLKHKSPPWNLHPKSINLSLSYINKNSNPPEIFRKEFARMQSEQNQNTTFIYTDGSQINGSTGYGITSSHTILSYGLLPPYTTVFSSEIIAIYLAIRLLQNKRGRYIICSDSLSSLKSIKNISNSSFYPDLIRNLLIRLYPKFTLLWIPSHINITGNELADQTAKKSFQFPLVYTTNNNSNDIKKHIQNSFILSNGNSFAETSNWYQSTNSQKLSICNFLNNNHLSISRLEETKLIRIRLGHTKITHSHYFTNDTPCNCPLCDSIFFNLNHLLNSCSFTLQIRSRFFPNNSPLSALTNPTADNIKLLIKFLKHSNIFHSI